MKKLLFLFILLFISCGRNNEEQMFYDYMDDLTIEAVNISVKDLDFKIISLTKVGVVYAKDSLDVLIKELSELSKVLEEDDAFIQENLEKIKNDELNLNKARNDKLQSRNELKQLLHQQQVDNYKKIIDLTQEMIDTKKEYSDERKLIFNKTTSRLEELKLNPNMVIANKYELKYSMHMPDTDLTNTFVGVAYTNGDDSKFIIIEYN